MAPNSTEIDALTKQRRKERQRQELQHYLISFAMMVFLTVLAFIAVATGNVSVKVVPMFIILLAVIQAAFQMFYFMHLKDKGHGFAAGVIASAVVVAVLTVATLMTLIW